MLDKYLLFSIGQNIHGIKISETGQIYEAKEPTPIPLSEKEVRGMVNIENTIRTVIDLGICLYGEKIDLSNPTEKRMVSLYNSNKCLLFDQAHEIIEMYEKDIQLLVIEDSKYKVGKYKDTVFSIINREDILEKYLY